MILNHRSYFLMLPALLLLITQFSFAEDAIDPAEPPKKGKCILSLNPLFQQRMDLVLLEAGLRTGKVSDVVLSDPWILAQFPASPHMRQQIARIISLYGGPTQDQSSTRGLGFSVEEHVTAAMLQKLALNQDHLIDQLLDDSREPTPSELKAAQEARVKSIVNLYLFPQDRGTEAQNYRKSIIGRMVYIIHQPGSLSGINAFEELSMIRARRNLADADN